MRHVFLGLVLCLVPTGSASARPATRERQASPAASLTKARRIQAFRALVQELGTVPRSCMLKGKRLQGKVQVVTSFPDLKVQRVTSFPDLKVKWVTAFPDRCGLWKQVTAFPDFKIQWVTSFPDLKITEVTSFPGLP
jgi:hypothetical protein